MENEGGVRVIRKKQNLQNRTANDSTAVRQRPKKTNTIPKFVNLYSEDGKDRETITLEGRHPCTCLASKHQLVNNCLSCGRIVCQQEGSGSCFTCGELVVSPKEQEMMMKDSLKANKLRQKLEEQDASLAAAIAHKNKLIEYDRSCAKRTQVIDDDGDYFSSENKWLTQKERRTLKEIEQKRDDAKSLRNSRRQYTIDIATKKVTECAVDLPELHLPTTKEAIETAVDNLPSYISEKTLAQLEYVDTDIKLRTRSEIDDLSLQRLQDGHIGEMCDEGLCLSMHQPYASLLIAGVKIHEGRNWYHAHRGRLWIHAAAHKTSDVELQRTLSVYRNASSIPASDFPKSFPTGVLLGCVDIVDCLPQGVYRERFPDGLNEDQYVFICENPVPLKMNIPMRGGAKIFKLETYLLNAARKHIMFN